MNANNKLANNRLDVFLFEKSKKSTIVEVGDSSLLFVLSGNTRISYDEKIGQEVKKGNFLLLQARSYFRLDVREPVKFILCPFLLENYFPENYVVKLFNPSINENAKVWTTRGRMDEFLSLLSDYLEDGIESDELYMVLKQELFILLKLYFSNEELSRFFAPIIGKDVVFKDFILKNCLNVETVEELASLANYSTSGFEKKFHRCFNESPYKWMLRYKAKRILQDIQASYKPFKDIAEQYGFSSQSYFYTFCRKHYGNSPREMRKESKLILKKQKR